VFGTGASLTQTRFIVTKVYDELMRTVLVLMKKLDLSIRKKINKETVSGSFILILEILMLMFYLVSVTTFPV
jgi:hypothetical protein